MTPKAIINPAPDASEEPLIFETKKTYSYQLTMKSIKLNLHCVACA